MIEKIEKDLYSRRSLMRKYVRYHPLVSEMWWLDDYPANPSTPHVPTSCPISSMVRGSEFDPEYE